MADLDQLFGSDSEEEKGDNKSDEESNGSASDSSGSSSGKQSPDSSRAASPDGSGPASPDGSGPASPDGSGPASPDGSGPASPDGSEPASPSGSGPPSPAGSNKSSGSSSSGSSSSSSSSGPGSPAGSGPPTPGGPGSPVGSEAASGAGSAPPSPTGSPSGSHKSKSPVEGGADDSGSDSDGPITKRRVRLPSDSGSDPDAVRATAEDIFGEADDISDEEGANKHMDEEEKEEEIPETRIEVEIPRVVADLGESLSFVKLPNFLSVETRPFDPVNYEDEIDEDEVMDEEGRARLKLKVENTIRWRHAKDPNTGLEAKDEFGEPIKESNARVTKWSDGSMSLYLGTEIFDIYTMPMQDHTHLYIRQGTGLQGQAMFKNKLSFRPHSTDSFTHRKMTMSLVDRSSKSTKIKVLPIAGLDPELSKTDNIKKEEERLRASIKRENQQRRTRERAHARSHISSSYLDDDEEGTSISAIKNSYKKSKQDIKQNAYSDSEEENEYESDGEDMRMKKLRGAKKLVDSDDEASSDDEETTTKRAKVIDDSEESS